jgi:hypothetical protein
MKRNMRHYLSDTEKQVNQHVMSANGQRHLGADGWLQRYQGITADVAAGQFFPADGGAGAGAGMSFSQPYIVNVSNASATTIADFDIWGAIIYLNNSQFTFSSGSLTISGITLSSGAPAPVTYYNMLQQSNVQNFSIGKTTLVVNSGSNAQINNAWTLKTFDMNGNFARRLFPNVISPNQYQSGVIDNYMRYDIDGSTAISLNVQASTAFTLYFYPIANINLSRSLIGQQAAAQFGAPPSNLPPQPVVVQNGQ